MAAPETEGARLASQDGTQLQRLSEAVAALREASAQVRGAAESREKMDRIETEIADITAQLGESTQGRRGQFSTEDAEEKIFDPDERHYQGRSADGDNRAITTVQRLHKQRSRDPEIVASQEALDDLYILSWAMSSGGSQNRAAAADSEYARDVMDRLPMVRRAVQTGSNVSGAWIPSDFSANLQERVRLALRVAAQHERIAMPTETYKLPIEGADATSYLVPEVTGNNDFPDDSTKFVTSGLDDPELGNLTLQAKKLGSRIIFSAEAEEDMIIPLLPYLRGKLARSMANAQEDTVLNGDTAGSHMDADITSAKDRRKAWDGYRKHAVTATKVAVAQSSTLDVQDLRNLRTAMGKYGINPADVSIVTGPKGYAKMLSLRDGANPSPVLTLEKYGPQAVIFTGELARIDGMPIIVSEYVREDLDSNGVFVGSPTNTKTILFMVNRSAFIFGDYRAPSIRSKDIIETDQTVMVTLQRLTFNNWWGGQGTQPLGAQPVVGYLKNVAI